MDGLDLQRAFLERLNDSAQFTKLFANVPGLCFFAKDRDGRIMMGNQLFVEHCGYKREADLIGRNDFEIFPADLAQAYVDDDNMVMNSEEVIVDRVELFPNYMGVPEWFTTSKMPLYDTEGQVAGVCGTTRSYEKSKYALQPYLDISPAVDFIRDNLEDQLSVPQLARKVHMSVRQFERKFKQAFRISPRAFIIKMRIHAACERLRSGNEPITNIALDLGFYDHSSFTRHFVKHMGTTPIKFRKADAS